MLQQDARSRQGQQAEAWRLRADDLAAWAMRTLVIRTDAYGAYTPPALRGKPGRDGRPIPTSYTSKRTLTHDVLARHFRGARPEHVVGLHTTAPDNFCRAGCFDVDRHDDDTDPTRTLAIAGALYRESIGRGLRALLTHSNGRGGYHLRLIFSEPVPSRDLHHLLKSMARRAGFVGEQFPKQAAIVPGGGGGKGTFGNWLRLPGRHHTRDCWSEVFDGARWLEGAGAVELLLTFGGDDPRLVPAAPASSTGQPRRSVDRPDRTSTDPAFHPTVAPMTRASAGGALDEQIARYLASCPNKSAGQGRDAVAFRLACYLVRDLGLGDHVALPWLAEWDRHNSPPKGEVRLKEILANAHIYGSHSYGSGRQEAQP